MFGSEKKEYGDYQTPPIFCEKVCKYLVDNSFDSDVEAILEPTCGVGNFISTAAETFQCKNLFGVEINESYAKIAKERVPNAKILTSSIFELNTKEIIGKKNILIIGNPPWATNSDLSNNLPRKINFKGLRGIDALTGASNFDICEYIILKLINEYENTQSVLCMLCKTSVARNVISEVSRKKIACERIEMLNFDSNKIFGVSAPACVLIIKLTKGTLNTDDVVFDLKEFDNLEYKKRFRVIDGEIKLENQSSDFYGKSTIKWRQGVKHDCSSVMELKKEGNAVYNKKGEFVNIEDEMIFPLVKSSHFKKPIINTFSRYVIVTQTKPKEDTNYIKEEFPKTWDYLNDNIDSFDKRKSVIYKNSPPFSMFGVGDYSFSKYKVGVSGFYKKPLFSLLYSDKPVMTDDTAYFIPFDDYDLAYCMMLLLNSEPIQKYLLSVAFLDSKRPYTVKLLSNLDLQKCIDRVEYETLCQTEKGLNLKEYVKIEHNRQLSEYIKSQNFC